MHSSGLCGYIRYIYTCIQNTHTYFLKDLKRGREKESENGLGKKERERKEKEARHGATYL